MSRWSRAYRGENDLDFPRWSRRFLVVSAVLVLISLVSLFTRGLELSLEFEGGSSWTVQSQDFEREDAEAVLAECYVTAALTSERAERLDRAFDAVVST